MRVLVALVAVMLVAACASMGRPEGGPRDVDPPVFMRSTPAPGSLNVKADRYTIYFNENVQIKDVMDKVVVSPPQKTIPKISAVGRTVRVEMMDSLLPNTTYTIDFTDAISDLNESNGLDGFAFDFSTGPTIDSLCISGMVFSAENLEPAQGMLVGVHSNLADTAITHLPFDRITRTNQLGQFVIRNLKPGAYNVFAINDVNRDNKWDRTEDIAFYGTVVSPGTELVEVKDTLMSVSRTDSIVSRMETRFTPDDLLLTWFNEGYKSQYLVKYERRDNQRIYIEMGAPADSLPQLTLIGGEFDGHRLDEFAVIDASPTLDTLEYWITEPRILECDSLMASTRYLRTDTNDCVTWTTDTLQFNLRKKDSKKNKKKKDNEQDSIEAAKTPLLNIKLDIPATIDVFSQLTVISPAPIRSWADSAVHLEILEDSVWHAVEAPRFLQGDSLRHLIRKSGYKWSPGAKYRLTIDSLGVTSIYGVSNGPVRQEFTVRRIEDYGNITFNLTNTGSRPVVVELLSQQDNPVKSVAAQGGNAVFRHVLPGTYYARLYFDTNRNGKWDHGIVADSIQPEEVYYFNKKINLKKNWDIEQAWDIFELPVDMQKPIEIKKNKPKKKTGEPDNYNDDEEDDQYYDEFGNPAVDPNDPFGKRKNQRYNTLNGRDQNQRGRAAGYR